MGTALIFLCIAVMIVGPALYMAGKLGASALVAWIAVSFIVLGLVAL